MSKEDTFDKVLNSYIRPLGQWQWRQFLFLCFTMGAPFVYIPAVANLIPPHRCRIPSLDSNLTYTAVTNLTIPFKSDPELPPMIGQEYYPCQRLNSRYYSATKIINLTTDPNSNIFWEPCTDGYTYDTSDHEFVGTIIEEFDLVCDRAYLAPVSLSVFMVAQMISCLLTGFLSDQYGRKIVIVASGFAQVTAGFAIAFSPNIIIYSMFQFIIGFSVIASFNTGYVHVMEITSVKYWNLFAILSILSFNFISGSVIVICGYVLQNWKWLHIAVAIFNLPCLLFPFTIYESPRWLLTQGRTKEAIEVSISAFRINNPKNAKINLEEFTDLIKELSAETQSKTASENITSTIIERLKRYFRDLFVPFRSSTLRRRTCFMAYIWFMTSSIFYGCTFNSVKLGYKVYVTLLFVIIISIPANITRYFLYPRLKRKILAMGTICMCTILFTAFFIVQILRTSSNTGLIEAILSIFGKYLIEICFSLIYGYTGELFPTEIRNYGLGFCSACARLASAITPFIVQSGETVWRPLPVLIFIGLLLVGALAVLGLPETRGVRVVETIRELDEQQRQLHGEKLAPKEVEVDVEMESGTADDDIKG